MTARPGPGPSRGTGPASPGAGASGPPSRPTDGLDSVVCFAIGQSTYALDVAVVREVVGVERLLAVPRTPAPIVGAFALRGATLALVDARILFGLDAGGSRATALVVARGPRAICGLTIDSVLGVTPFAGAAFQPAVRGREPLQVAGFFTDERGGLITVLDTQNLLHALERLRF
jgi:purine-binding chemotaxis protein CheW